MPSAICPECEEDVFVDANAEQGKIITCESCDAELELVGLDPIELDPYYDFDFGDFDDGFVFDDEEEDDF